MIPAMTDGQRISCDGYDLIKMPGGWVVSTPSGAVFVAEKSSQAVAKPPPSERGIAFAVWFKGLLPETTRPQSDWKDAWARIFDDLIRLDKRTEKDIAAVCEWARRDEFWQRNFLSPKKLRERNRGGVNFFDVFTAAMNAKEPVGKDKLNDVAGIRMV